MPGKAKVEAKPFEGIRLTVSTARSYDSVLDRLRGLMGTSTVGDIVSLAKEPISEEEFARQVETRHIGESGFTLFGEIDHGGWLPKFGIEQRSVRWIVGNPLIAITMIRLDITAGLFAPVELLVTEKKDRTGTTVTYVRPSTLMVIDDNPPLLAAAEALDAKFAALVDRATGD